MKAVQFGAGNIGRGLVGPLLHEAGYEVVFVDVADAMVDAINAASSYTVHALGAGADAATEVTGFRAVNSATDPEVVADEIATADVVTTSVGPTILTFIAPLVLTGLRRRAADRPPLQIMACENEILATDHLRTEIALVAEDGAESLPAVFANTAIDRIVPAPQPPGSGVDVTVEPFFEWVIESRPFGDRKPRIPSAHFVDDLVPYIERKLFSVNTAHAAAAYFGTSAGVEFISEALAEPVIATRVAAVLEQTSAMLSRKHGFDAAELAAYRATILDRFRNPAMRDTVRRVGRQPLRKLSRHERFIGPAAEAAEFGLPVDALVAAIGAVLAFVDPDDAQAVEMQRLLRTAGADEFTQSMTGLQPLHPLYAVVRERVAAHQAELTD